MKVALITGGTSGIGLATARRLFDAGHGVALVGRDAERGIRVADELGDRALYVKADVSRAPEMAAALEVVMHRFGRLDWAVNAAALADTSPTLTADIAESDWDRTVGVALKGMWLSMKHEIPVMVKGGGGSIVNVSSVNGLSGTPGAAAYCAAKHGVHGLSKTAALEYASQRVRVNVVCPGAHDTPMLRGVFEAASPGKGAEVAEMYRSRIPLGRIAAPDECARAIEWLLSDAASYVTGAVMTVDGGLAAGLA